MPKPPRQRPSRDIVVRRLIALGIAVLVFILLLVGIRGCLDARKERGFDNFTRDLSAIIVNANQLSKELFSDQLGGAQDLSEQQFTAAINSDRGAAGELLNRVEGLDTPDQLAEAHGDLVLAFEFRADALDGIATQIPTALGDEGAADARTALVGYMRQLLASDVLYARAKAEIDRVLEEEGITPDEPVPESVFLPEPVDVWLDDLKLGGVLSNIALETGAAPKGLHGTEVESTIIRPGNLQLLPDTENTVQADGNVEIEVSVFNSGESEENAVVVSYSLSGGGTPIEGQGEISRIAAGNTESVAIAIQGDIPTGTPLTLTVTVQPVPGETLLDNNESVYPVTFE